MYIDIQLNADQYDGKSKDEDGIVHLPNGETYDSQCGTRQDCSHATSQREYPESCYGVDGSTIWCTYR